MSATNEPLMGNDERAMWLPLLEVAVKEVFEIMLGCKLTRAPEGHGLGNADFTAMVGLAGQFCGLLSIRCSVDTATLIAAKMLGVSPTEANSQMWDAVGEVCNMVAGNFKSKLAGMGDHCMLSVPSVITGGDYTFHALSDSGPLELTMMFEGAPLQVTLEVHS